MEVGIEVMAEDLITGEIRHIASSSTIYVALDEHGKPTPVPPLVPAYEEEAARIEQARIRRLHIQKLDEELAKWRKQNQSESNK
jgi:acyl-CoA hydrolase